MITLDGTDSWDARTIHDTVFSYTIDEKGIYVRNCKTNWTDVWSQFEVGTITTATYTNGKTFTLTRTVNNIDLVYYEETTSMHVEGNSTTWIYSTGTAYSFFNVSK